MIQDCSDKICSIIFEIQTQVEIKPFAGSNCSIILLRKGKERVPSFRVEIKSQDYESFFGGNRREEQKSIKMYFENSSCLEMKISADEMFFDHV